MKKSVLLLCCSLCLGGCGAQTDGVELRQQIAQLLLVGFRGVELTPDSHIYSDVKNLGIGGVILFDYDMPSHSRPRNIVSSKQMQKLIADLQAVAPIKLLVAIDEEGGKVSRLRRTHNFMPTVTAKYQGIVDHVDTTSKYARQTATNLAELGFNLNFAPCVDVDVNPLSPVIGKLERSFSANPAQVVKHAAIWIDEHDKQGIATCIKHFPGHGSATSDTHIGIADVTHTWTEKELEPYNTLIKTGKAKIVMISHVFNAGLDAQYPATMSEKIVTGVLRNQLGFDGLIVTDDLAMGALVAYYTFEEILIRSLLAGNDLLCLSNNGETYDPELAQKAVNLIYKAVQDGRIPRARIEESYKRIKKLKYR